MYDQHIKDAEIAAQEELRDLGFNCSLAVAATIFRSAAQQWARDISDDDLIEELAEQHRQELAMEM